MRSARCRCSPIAATINCGPDTRLNHRPVAFVVHGMRIYALALAAVAALVVGLAGPPVATAADDRLQFAATTIDGAPFNGASLQGRPAVLWFWTPWCPFCNAEASSVSRVAAANPQVTFVGVAAHSEVAAMQNFVAKYQLNFTNLNDADGVDLGAIQRAVAARVRVRTCRWHVDVREQPDVGDVPAGVVRPGRGADVDVAWTRTWPGWPSPPGWWRR